MLPLVAAGLTVKATVELGEGEEIEVKHQKTCSAYQGSDYYKGFI